MSPIGQGAHRFVVAPKFKYHNDLSDREELKSECDIDTTEQDNPNNIDELEMVGIKISQSDSSISIVNDI